MANALQANVVRGGRLGVNSNLFVINQYSFDENA